VAKLNLAVLFVTSVALTLLLSSVIKSDLVVLLIIVICLAFIVRNMKAKAYILKETLC